MEQQNEWEKMLKLGHIYEKYAIEILINKYGYDENIKMNNDYKYDFIYRDHMYEVKYSRPAKQSKHFYIEDESVNRSKAKYFVCAITKNIMIRIRRKRLLKLIREEQFKKRFDKIRDYILDDGTIIEKPRIGYLFSNELLLQNGRYL